MEKLIGIKTVLSQTESLPQTIALTDAKLKFSVVTRSPVWHKLECYKVKNKILNPDENGSEMLLYIRKHHDYKEIDEHNGFEEMQLYELLLDGGNLVIASMHGSLLTCSDNRHKVKSFLKKLGVAAPDTMLLMT